MSKKLISIIVPAFNEAENLPLLAERLHQLFEGESQYAFEVILIENGSFDQTYSVAKDLNEKDARFKVIKFSRNFLVEGAIFAGLRAAKGHAAVILYADLEDPPEVIHEFLRKWEEGFLHVYGVIKRRQGTWLRRFNSKLFYWIINKLSGNVIPKNVADFRLIDRRVINAFVQMGERRRLSRGLFAWTGFKSCGVPFDRSDRKFGESKASTVAVLSLAMRGILSFSYFPLRIALFLGIFLSMGSFIALLVNVVQILVFDRLPFGGYGTIICSIYLLFGFLFILVGVLSEYIAMIAEEVKGRPPYIIEDQHGLS